MTYSDRLVTDFLFAGLRSLGLEPSEQVIEQFAVYLMELKKWNKAMNLTGIRDDQGIITKHFFDSLLYLNVIPDSIHRVADIGSGAGFPGIPIKIVRPEIEMVLIEPAMKKSLFLKNLAKSLCLHDVHVVAKRIEEVNVVEDLGAPVDVAVTRALFGVREFVRKASRILQPGGICILNKGPKVHDELRRITDLDYDVKELPLPHSTVSRHIVTVRSKTADRSKPKLFTKD